MKEEHVSDINQLSQQLKCDNPERNHRQNSNCINLKITEYFGDQPQNLTDNDCCVIYMSMASMSPIQAYNQQYVKIAKFNKQRRKLSHKQDQQVLAVCKTMHGLQNWEIRVNWMLRRLLKVKLWQWVTIFAPFQLIPALTKIVIKQLPCIIPKQLHLNSETIIKHFFNNAFRPINKGQVLQIPLTFSEYNILNEQLRTIKTTNVYGYAKVTDIEPNNVSNGIVDNNTKIQISSVGAGWNYHQIPSPQQHTLNSQTLQKIHKVLSHISLISSQISLPQPILARNLTRHHHMLIFCNHKPICQTIQNYLLNTVPLPCYTLDGTLLGESSQFIGVNIMNNTVNQIRSKCNRKNNNNSNSKGNQDQAKVLIVFNIDDVLSKQYLRGSVQRRSQSMLLELISQAHRDGLIVIATATSKQNTDAAVLRRIIKSVQIKVDKNKVFQLYQNFDSDLMTILKAQVQSFDGKLEYEDIYKSFNQCEDQIKKYIQVPKQCRQQVSYIITQNFNKYLKRYYSQRSLRFQNYIEKVIFPDQSFRQTLYGLQKLKYHLVDKFQNIQTQQNSQINKFGTSKNSLLLYGPPGCGKLSLAKAIAHQLSVTYIHIKANKFLQFQTAQSHFSSSSYSQSQRYISRMKPCMLIIQNLQQIQQQTDGYGNYTQSSRGMNSILTMLDCQLKNTIFVAISDRSWEIQQAFLRPGRFDTFLYVPLPDDQARAKIIGKYSKFQIGEQLLQKIVNLTKMTSCQQIISNFKQVNQDDQSEYFQHVIQILKSKQKQPIIFQQQIEKYNQFKITQDKIIQKVLKKQKDKQVAFTNNLKQFIRNHQVNETDNLKNCQLYDQKEQDLYS